MGSFVYFLLARPIRLTRGYAFEHFITQQLEKCGWKAYRLGNTTENLPDILATYNDTIYSIEAKSIMTPASKFAYIPKDQIQRCMDMLDGFKIFPNRYLVFAFKFSVKGSSKPKYHYFGFDMNDEYMIGQFGTFMCTSIRCELNGSITQIQTGTPNIEVQYSNYSMILPFAPPLELYRQFVK